MENERKSEQRSAEAEEKGEWRPRCTYCKCGHSIVYYLKPPLNCPYCNAKLLSDQSVCRRLDFS
jgi:hypothetical protein